MALQKNPININFSQGLQTKVDPYQVPIGQFQALTNTIFTKDGLQQKRNGFELLIIAPTGAQTLCTLNSGLVALGDTCQSYSADSGKLTNAGIFQPMDLSTVPMVRRATSQTTCDVAVASNGLACSTWLDSDGNSYYQVSDSVTGQIIVPTILLPSTATASRVYSSGQFFILTFLATVSAASHLQYIAIPISNPANPGSPVDISTQAASLSAPYDGQVSGNNLYISLYCTGNNIKTWYLTATLTLVTPNTMGGITAGSISVAVDTSNAGFPIIWVSYLDTATTLVRAYALNNDLTVHLAPTTIDNYMFFAAISITSTATNNVLTVIYNVEATYTYTPAAPEASDIRTDYLEKNTLTLSGVAGTASLVCRGVGLASRAVLSTALNKTVFLSTYGQAFQPTYFLMDLSGNVLARLAYSNGGGYLINQVAPNINQDSSGVLRVGYRFADLLQAVSKVQGDSTTGVYAQLGINLATFELGGQTSALEIGGSLHASGGMLWQYDGVKIRELNFNVWPEDVGFDTSTVGGFLKKQIYFYQVTYEWTDAAGQIHRSAPSVPMEVDISASGTDTNTVTLHIPTLRQTYKTDNKVRIVAYRWSTAQQTYHRVTSISNPTLNDPTSTDSIDIIDTLSDASIDGNDIIYTNGGVIEDICAPGSNAMTLWQSRLFMVDAEDQNLIWFSKQVIEATPVEMSDLLTLFIAPTTGAQGSTGPITALSSMDDKLVIFKQDAIYYITGQGPDNTGNNGTFSDPVFITSTVGCINPQSIVLTPQGIMFQSDKGIWVLGRNLETSYLGSPVETYTAGNLVTSALCIPATNQVRFTLNNRTAVLYDYFYNRWADWTNVSAMSSVVYQGVQAFLNTYGQIVLETPGQYLDVSTPVLLGLTTGWINLAGVQGLERFYFAYLLGTYYTPFTLNVQLAYDYNPSPEQAIVITPDNYVPNWGGEAQWGSGGPWGGPGNAFKARFFPAKQKCESFQLTIQEVYDPSLGAAAGAGLTLSGINMVVGTKRGYRTQNAGRSFG